MQYLIHCFQLLRSGFQARILMENKSSFKLLQITIRELFGKALSEA